MLCSTHRLIANKVYEIMTSELGMPIDYESLLNGSVAPDKKPYMIIIPHTKNQSLGFLNRYFNWMADKSLPKKFENLKEVSYKLGIIIHFVSDYFCTAHNDVKFINPVTHYIYEKRLKHFFNKKISRVQFDVKKCLYDIPGNLNDFINKKHKEYLSGKRNMENDFYFSLEAVITVITYIVNNLLKEYDFGFFAKREQLLFA